MQVFFPVERCIPFPFLHIISIRRHPQDMDSLRSIYACASRYMLRRKDTALHLNCYKDILEAETHVGLYASEMAFHHQLGHLGVRSQRFVDCKLCKPVLNTFPFSSHACRWGNMRKVMYDNRSLFNNHPLPAFWTGERTILFHCLPGNYLLAKSIVCA